MIPIPIYEYECQKHGIFQVIEGIGTRQHTSCPDCRTECVRVVSKPAPAVFHESERLPLGNKSRGRYLSSKETGGVPILIPSWGVLEKEEIDYIAEAAISEEKERVRRAPPRDSQVALGNLVKETKKAPKGKRKLTMDKIIKERMV